jgi:hypothetical protein
LGAQESLEKGKTVVVRQPDPAPHLTPQNDQLMPENRILTAVALM